jgi:hypothetical protein
MAELPLFAEAEQEAGQGEEHRDDAEHHEVHVSSRWLGPDSKLGTGPSVLSQY